jgi:hypothetical protein
VAKQYNKFRARRVVVGAMGRCADPTARRAFFAVLSLRPVGRAADRLILHGVSLSALGDKRFANQVADAGHPVPTREVVTEKS